MPKEDLPADQPHREDAGTRGRSQPSPGIEDGGRFRGGADAGSQVDRMRAYRTRAAELAETIARQADSFASYLEESAPRGDTERRLGIASVEREIAEIERRNAAKLRSHGSEPLHLEHLPSLPGTEPPAEG